MKIYIAGPMFNEPDISFNRHLHDLLLTNNFKVYCPNDNVSINDKSGLDITNKKYMKKIFWSYLDVMFYCVVLRLTVVLCRKHAIWIVCQK